MELHNKCSFVTVFNVNPVAAGIRTHSFFWVNDTDIGHFVYSSIDEIHASFFLIELKNKAKNY